MVDAAPEAKEYCTNKYLDVIFPGKHIYDIHNKDDTFTVEGVAVFVQVYNRFGFQKERYRSRHPGDYSPFCSLWLVLTLCLDTPKFIRGD